MKEKIEIVFADVIIPASAHGSWGPHTLLVAFLDDGSQNLLRLVIVEQLGHCVRP
ncbi:MAG: hypothetical protein OXH52_03675 [Gammaproteobacteria bacterium]|nr:hypothetical protein [Gammaproteobacteria bacterium]